LRYFLFYDNLFVRMKNIYRGRYFSREEIEGIRKIIKRNFHLSRTKLSRIICEKLNWRSQNGQLKWPALREVLLRMEKEKVINLPAPLRPCYNKKKISEGEYRHNFKEPKEEIRGRIEDYTNLNFSMVRKTEKEKLWNFLIDRYHYLGYRIMVGAHLKYIVSLDGNLIGCMGFADSVFKLNLRDEWIGWNQEEKNRKLHLIINNVRFLILPWVKIKNLASKLLSLSLRQVKEDWYSWYRYYPVLCETFVDIGKFKGSCYKAANWIYLGRTKGKGRHGQNYYWHYQPKDLYVYPLCKDAIKILKEKG